MSTISSSLTHGITIGNSGSYTYPSPLTITSAGTVSDGTYTAVFSSIANPVLDNQGTISATGNYEGVLLRDGGSVDNNAGLIEGSGGSKSSMQPVRSPTPGRSTAGPAAVSTSMRAAASPTPARA